MSRLAYYKCTDPEVLKIAATREADIARLLAKAKLFEAHFGGTLIVQNGLHAYRVVGLCFLTPKDTQLWTKPDPKLHNLQRPRTKVAAALKAESELLKSAYDQLCPTETVSLDPLLNALGTDWGNLVFSNGFNLRTEDDAVYVATSVKLNELCEEILASEFSASEGTNG